MTLIASWRVEILIGSDNQNWSSCYESLTIGDAERDSSGLIPISGRLRLAVIRNPPESMNPRTSTGKRRFARGQRVIISLWNGSSWVRHPRGFVYIARPPLPPTPGNPYLDIDLVCALDLQRFPQPAALIGSPQIQFGPTPTSPIQIFNLDRNALITTCLQRAGTPAQIGVAVGRYPYKEPFYSDPGSGYAEYAGKIAYGGIETLYQDNQNVIRSTSIALSAATPIATVAIGQDEVSYESIDGGETPVERVNYEGLISAIKPSNRGRPDPGNNTPTGSDGVSVEYGPIKAIDSTLGDGFIAIRRVTEIEGLTGNGKFSQTTVEEPLGLISSVAYPKNTSMSLSLRERTEHQYDSQGKLLSITKTITQPFVKACSEYFSTLNETEQAGYTSSFVDSTEIERREYDGKNRLARTTVVAESVVAAVISDEVLPNPLNPQITKIESTEYREVRSGEWRRIYQVRMPTIIARPNTQFDSPNANDRIQAKLALFTTKYENKSSNAGQETPPATETSPQTIETEPRLISASATFQVTNLGFSERERTYRLETACAGAAQLQELAQIQGALLIGRAQGARIQLPLLDAFINSPRPLQTIAVIETEVLASGWRRNLIFYQLDGLEFTHESDRAVVTASLIWLGTIEGGLTPHAQTPIAPTFQPAAIVPPYESIATSYEAPSDILVTEPPIAVIAPQILEIVAEAHLAFGGEGEDVPYSLTLSWVAEAGLGFGARTDFVEPIIAIGGIGFGGEGTLLAAPLLAEAGLGLGAWTDFSEPIIAIGGIGFGGEGTISALPLLAEAGLGVGAESRSIDRFLAQSGIGLGAQSNLDFLGIAVAGLGFGGVAIASVSDMVYTASQSSVFASLTGTYTNLTDGSGTTGAGTGVSPAEFIRADFGEPVSVSSVTVGGGTLPGWGAVAPYLNGRLIQYSTDNTSWTTAATISGVTDSGGNQFRAFTFTAVTARYWRIATSGSGYLSTTEFRFA